jgi:hypothetical protein
MFIRFGKKKKIMFIRYLIQFRLNFFFLKCSCMYLKDLNKLQSNNKVKMKYFQKSKLIVQLSS